MKGKKVTRQYRGTTVTGIVLHQEGTSLLVRVTATGDSAVVKVGQMVVVDTRG